MKRKNEITIRSSAAEYLTFISASGEGGVEAVYADENVWLSQKMMALLYDVSVSTINEHITNILDDKEVDENSTIRKFRIVQMEGNREVEREVYHYNLKAIISVGYKVDSEKELSNLGRLVSAYLDLAEDRAERHIPMTMKDWEERLNAFLELMEYGVLSDNGKVSAEIAKQKAETEFEKFRIVQDKMYSSDFDKYIDELLINKDKN